MVEQVLEGMKIHYVPLKSRIEAELAAYSDIEVIDASRHYADGTQLGSLPYYRATFFSRVPENDNLGYVVHTTISNEEYDDNDFELDLSKLDPYMTDDTGVLKQLIHKIHFLRTSPYDGTPSEIFFRNRYTGEGDDPWTTSE